MRLMPRVHDWYVGRAVLFTVLLTWAVLLGLDLVNAFASEAKNIGQGAIPLVMRSLMWRTRCRGGPTPCSPLRR